MTALLDILARVAAGEIPRETGIETIVLAFSAPRPVAEKVMGKLGTSAFVPAVPDGSEGG